MPKTIRNNYFRIWLPYGRIQTCATPLLGFDVSTLSPTGPDADGITRVMTAIAGSEKSE